MHFRHKEIKGSRQHLRSGIALLLATVLVLSFAVPGFMTQNSYAASKSTSNMIEHIPNSGKEITISSATLNVKSASTSHSKSVTVEIREDGGALLATGKLDLGEAKMKNREYTKATVTFDPSVKVNGDLQVNVKAKGVTVHTFSDSKHKTPGYLEIDGKTFKNKDIDLRINNQKLADVIANAEQTETSGQGGDDSGQGSSDNPGSSSTVRLLVNAKDQNSKSIDGLWIVVYQELSIVQAGPTPKNFTLEKGESYTVYLDDYTDGVTTYTFAGWEDSQQGNFRTATLTSDETFTAKYNVESASQSGSDNTDTGSTDTGSDGSGSGTTTAGSPNTVTISSQLLDGSAITGLEAQLREAGTGVNVGSDFTPATLQMEDGKDYKAIMYSFSPYWFRHWTDGGLHRYHLVSGDGQAHSFTAQFEQIPASQEAQLTIQAKTTDGTPIGSTSGTQEDNTLQTQPGIEVLVAPPGTLTPYTAGFTGGSEATPFHLMKGQTYTVIVQEFGHYKFLKWEDNGSTNRARSVPLNSSTQTLTAIYELV